MWQVVDVQLRWLLIRRFLFRRATYFRRDVGNWMFIITYLFVYRAAIFSNTIPPLKLWRFSRSCRFAERVYEGWRCNEKSSLLTWITWSVRRGKVVRSKFIYISHLAEFSLRLEVFVCGRKLERSTTPTTGKKQINFVSNTQCLLLNRAWPNSFTRQEWRA